jgi:hypothetical protein
MAEVAQFRLEHRGVSPSFELHLLDLPISDLPILDLPIFELPILVTKLLILCMGGPGNCNIHSDSYILWTWKLVDRGHKEAPRSMGDPKPPRVIGAHEPPGAVGTEPSGSQESGDVTSRILCATG